MATLGDFLTRPHEKGGWNFGTIGSSAVLAAVLVVVIAGASYAQRRYGRSPVAEVS
ncbi:putative membrane-anchored protein [Pseudomonas sp. JAI120]|nr:putative membrane-anchored protein [Pseudomonas sp. SJZ073]MBB6312593.1 putative membrane-anchored protein [Pseudomonas sp. JAI120]